MKKYKLNLTILGINLTQDNDFTSKFTGKTAIGSQIPGTLSGRV